MNIINTFLRRLWIASPRAVAEYFSPGFFSNRILIEPVLPFDIDSNEIQRLKTLQRHESTTTQFLGKLLEIVDVDSYFSMCDELFVKRNYEFEACRKDPLIIDCGSNIGLSIIYFKQLYPECRIIAFEADNKVFNSLNKNISSFGFKDVAVNNKAVWITETEVDFYAEGSWGGRLPKPDDVDNIVKVKTVRLKDFLNQKVDFLKIDVEGSETLILRDCADCLDNVQNLFVEYHSFTKEKQTLQELLSILHTAGFRYHIKEASIATTRKLPFLERTLSGMDLQLEIFAFRD